MSARGNSQLGQRGVGDDHGLTAYRQHHGSSGSIGAIVFPVGSVIHTVPSDRRCFAFERGELRDKPLVVKQPRAAGGEERERIQVDRGPVAV